jgi:hypothetical protein
MKRKGGSAVAGPLIFLAFEEFFILWWRGVFAGGF